jgi:hypothetical protein
MYFEPFWIDLNGSARPHADLRSTLLEQHHFEGESPVLTAPMTEDCKPSELILDTICLMGRYVGLVCDVPLFPHILPLSFRSKQMGARCLSFEREMNSSNPRCYRGVEPLLYSEHLYFYYWKRLLFHTF